MSEPYDPQNPDMPPLINDIIVDWEKFNAEAEESHKAAAKIGFTGAILLGGRVGKLSADTQEQKHV